MTNTRKTKPRAGFSLIELMVSMIAGSVVIAGVWYTGGASSRMFGDQLRRAETQTSLRSASEAMTRDISRAGLFSVRSTLDPAILLCPAISPVAVNAVQVTVDANGNHVLTLSGNFSSSYQYPAIDPGVGAANALQVQPIADSFTDSFSPLVGGVPTYNPALFLQAFLPNPATPNVPQGRMISIFHLGTGTTYLRAISGVTANGVPPTVSFVGMALNSGSGSAGCLTNLAGLVIAPISMVRYAIVSPAAIPGLASVAAATGDTRNVLVRTEVDMMTNVNIPGSERIVCDYARRLRLTAVIDTALPGLPPTLVQTTTPEAPTINPWEFRTLTVDLEADIQANTASAVDPATTQARNSARRATRFEVFMPNMAITSGGP